MKLGKKRGESSNRNYYIISQKMIIKAILIVAACACMHACVLNCVTLCVRVCMTKFAAFVAETVQVDKGVYYVLANRVSGKAFTLCCME